MSETIRYKIGLDGSSFERGMGSAIGQVTKLGGVLAGLGASAVFVGLIKQGFAFNKTMKDSEAAIAQVLAQFKGLNAAAAKQEAAEAMRQLIDLEPKVSGGLTDLVGGFMATLAASQSAGISVKENIDLVGRFSNAMANTKLPAEQLAQEMRSIITATIGADSQLAKMLQITNDMVNQARESGQLYQFLKQKIGDVGLAADTAEVAFNTLKSAIDKAAGALTAGLFDQAVGGSQSLTLALNDNIATFERMGAALAQLGTWAAQALQMVDQMARALGITAAVFEQMLTNGLSYTEAWEAAQKSLTDEINNTGRAIRANTPAPGAPPAPVGAPPAAAPAPAAGAEPGTLNSERGTAPERRRIVSRRDGSTFARARLMGSAGGGGLDQLTRLQQKREVGFDEQQATRKARGGGRGLPIGQSTSFVPAFAAFPPSEARAFNPNRVTNPAARPVGDRIAAATRREDRQQQRSNQQSDPTLQALKNIEAELKRIRTA